MKQMKKMLSKLKESRRQPKVTKKAIQKPEKTFPVIKKEKLKKKSTPAEKVAFSSPNQSIENSQIERLETQIDEEEFVQQKSHLIKNWKEKFSLPAFYTGGKIILSLSEEKFFCQTYYSIGVFELSTLKIIDSYSHGEEEICNFVVSAKEDFLVSFTKAYMFRVFDVGSQEVVKFWKCQDFFAIDMCLHPVTNYLAACTHDGSIRIFDTKKGKQIQQYRNHHGVVMKVLFHPDPKMLQLISLGEDTRINFYDLILNKCIKTLTGHKEQITSMFLSKTVFSTVGMDQTVRVWAFNSKKERQVVEFSEEVTSTIILEFPEEDLQISISGTETGKLLIFEIGKDEKQICSDYITHKILKLIKCKKSREFFIVTEEQNILKISYELIEGSLKFQRTDFYFGYNDEIIELKFLKRNLLFPYTSIDIIPIITNSNMMRLYDMKENKMGYIMVHDDITLALDTFGPFVLTAGKDQKIILVRIDSLNDYKHIAMFTGHTADISNVIIAPKQGKFFASVSEDHTLKTWALGFLLNVEDDQPLQRIKVSSNTVFAHEKGINAVRISPNDKFIATCSQDRTIKVFKSDTLSIEQILKGHKRGIWDIKFSPIEQVIASASGDNTIKLWNISSGECINTFEGHENSILNLSFCCHGLQLVSGSGDGLLKTWNIAKNQCVSTLEKHSGKLWAIDIHEDKKLNRSLMLTGDNDSQLTIWEDDTIQVEEEGRNQLNEKLKNLHKVVLLSWKKSYLDAAKLAFDLEMKRELIKNLKLIVQENSYVNKMIFNEDKFHDGAQENENKQLHEFITHAIAQNLKNLILLIRDLNTNAKNSQLAQLLLQEVLAQLSIDKIEDTFNELKQRGENLTSLINVIQAFSEKHFDRVNMFIKRSYMLNFFLKKAGVLIKEKH